VTGPSDVVSGELVTFLVTCPVCHEQSPLPVTTVTPLLGRGFSGNWLSVEVGPVYRLPHTCEGIRQ
jgi:hypothetical protein